MHDDGSAVDHAASDDAVVIMDAATGEVKMVSPEAIMRVETGIDPEQERARMYSEIEAELQAKQSAIETATDISDRNATGEQKGDKPAEATEPNNPKDDANDGSNFVGRSLTEAEATEVIGRMEANAETAPELELTPENWLAEFGEDSEVETPVGTVKMGENQYFKLAQQGRDGKLGMVKPTLHSPDVIIEDFRPATTGQSERDTSLVFIKTFTKSDGQRYYYFTSITVSKGGREVVISNQERSAKRISKLLQQGKIVWIK
ncbi:MAG: hypothetical protein K2M80_01535, partial [Muribaculaceae bacterium]|nr:hypothetical protein [Muribaculaceae bacterium]